MLRGPDRSDHGDPRPALLDDVLARCDEGATAAYLEASRPESVPFYERFGFTVHHELHLPDGPPVWGMWRAPGASDPPGTRWERMHG